MSFGKTKFGEKFGSRLVGAGQVPDAGFRLGGYWSVRASRNGETLWEEPINNIVNDQMLGVALDVVLLGGTQVSTWYVGLIQTGLSVASGDVMSSHAGWTECTAYDDSTRPIWSGLTNAALVVTNSGTLASFVLNAATAVGGAFLAQQNNKSGVTGYLFAAGAFTGGDRTGLASGDTLQVLATFRAIDDA